MNKLIAAVTPGIRAKLSFFTAFFVIIIISIVSALYLNQEFKTLTQSLDREIQPLRKYTERIVLDLENISSSLLLIEDFRFRLKSKQKELKQYKKKIVRVVEEKSWFTKNVLGKLNVIQKDLINTRDKKRVWTFDTFYSEYITDKKINEIEDNIRSQMRDEKGNIISKEKFAYIQKFAHKAEEYRKKLEEQEQKINEYNSEKVEKNEKGEKVTDPKILSKNKEIDKKIEKVTKELNLTKIRMEESIRDLNSEILKFFYQGQRNSIKELALNTDLIRIQTFNIKDFKVGFDTKIFSDSNSLNSNQFTNHKLIVEDLENRVKTLNLKEIVNLNFDPESIEVEGKEYEIFFSPILRKPSVVWRANKIIELANSNSSQWKDFLQKDKEVSEELSKISSKLKERIKELREKKKGKPSSDKEYVNLYKEYKKVLEKRKSLNEEMNTNKEFKVEGAEIFLTRINSLKEDITSNENSSKEKEELIKSTKDEEQILALKNEIEVLNQKKEDLQSELKFYEDKLNDWSWTNSLLNFDAISHLREASIYEFAILRYKYNANSYSEFLESKENRELLIKKWEIVRDWITKADSEVKIKSFSFNKNTIDPFEGGVLSRSRSEVEEFMWQMDSTPLYQILENSEPAGLAPELFVSYIAGFTRTIVDKSNGMERIKEDIRRIVYNSGFIGITAIGFAFLFSGMMVKNIRRISQSAQLVGKGNLDVQFQIKSKDEIGRLSETLNQMVTGLIERDKVKNALGRFVNPQIAEMVLKKELKLGGEKKDCAIFFSDIRSFTAISETMEPENVVEFLNEYMSAMVHCVNQTHGVVDKFIGDAIMATWGAAFSKGNDAENGVNAALLMRKALMKFNEGRGSVEKPIIKIGCGLNFGPVIAGQIGSEERLEYTVIGDAVNLASRVESLNKPLGTDILITQGLYDHVQDIFKVEKMQSIQVKGKKEPQTIYAVLGRLDDPDSPQNLNELRNLLGIDFDSSKKVNLDEKEEKFKIIE